MIIQVLEPISTKGLTLKDVEKLSEEVRSKMTQAFKKINEEVTARAVSK